MDGEGDSLPLEHTLEPSCMAIQCVNEEYDMARFVRITAQIVTCHMVWRDSCDNIPA